MKAYIEELEDNVIRKYGFESHLTIAVFHYTELLRKWFRID